MYLLKARQSCSTDWMPRMIFDAVKGPLLCCHSKNPTFACASAGNAPSGDNMCCDSNSKEQYKQF